MIRAIRLLELTFALLLAAFGLLFWQINLTSDLAHTNQALALQGNQARTALCAFRSDLADRANQAEALLRAHPTGLAGISAAVIQSSIANQRATLTALAQLDCPKEGTP